MKDIQDLFKETIAEFMEDRLGERSKFCVTAQSSVNKAKIKARRQGGKLPP